MKTASKLMLKHHFSFIFFIIIFSSFIFLYPSHGAAEEAIIKSDTLNVRNGPGLTSEVITQIHKGEAYPILQVDGEWIQLQLTNQKLGWVAGWLIERRKESVTGKKVKPTVDSLRVRSGPGTNFQVLGSLSKNDKVEQLDQNANWTKIKYNGKEAWVSSSFISNVASSENDSSLGQEEKTSKEQRVKINASILNVRKTPDLTAPIIGKLTQGSTVSYNVFENGWYSINFKEKIGWISGDFASIIESQNKTTKQQNKKTMTSSNKAIIEATILNVRKEASLTSSIVEKLKKGTTVTILNEQNDWSQIKINNTTGWVANEYLTKTEGVSSQSTLTILNDGTNIRKGPSTNTEVVQRANEDDTFNILAKEDDWYKIQLSNGENAYIAGWIVEVNGPIEKVGRPDAVKQLQGKTIIIDPGHGGKDSGTIGIAGTLEKKLTSRTAELLTDKLEASGANVILTRKGDRYITLNYRVSLSHYYNADAFISLHYDSTRHQQVNGISTFYYSKPDDYLLAKALHAELIKNTNLNDREVKHGNFHVLRENKRPSVLLELGFLSNKREEWYVNSSDYQEKAARAIYQGLINYFE